ncbi:MAG: hypothetical protein HQK55_18710, partial [Deltaproteobacteria bacterium]|nr:hypothetical protein [Deltaproteobacteria bacterium]
LCMSMCYILVGDVRTNHFPTGLPEPIREFILAMLRQCPQDRPKDCNQLNQDLTRIRQQVFGLSHSM